MFKGLVYGFFAGLILAGSVWFIVGRTSIADIRRTTDGFNGDLERTERLISEFGTDFERYTGKISIATGESEGLRDELGDLRDEFGNSISDFGEIKSGLGDISDGVDVVEDYVRRSNVLSRDFADLLYQYRRLGEASGTEE